MAYKAPGAKVSSFIRMTDILEVEDITPVASSTESVLAVRCVGNKEYRVILEDDGSLQNLLDSFAVLLLNTQFLATLKSTMEKL